MSPIAMRMLSAVIKFFFLLTPFFVLSVFLTLTNGYTGAQRRKLAHKVAFASLLICTILLFFGRWIFNIFGITLDAFRIGAGVLLFLSGIKLANGAAGDPVAVQPDSEIAVVPLAIPVVVGPATTGALLVVGVEAADWFSLFMAYASLLIALLGIWGFMCAANFLERLLKHRGIVTLSKITGLILSALAAEMIFTGVRNFMFNR